MHYLPFRLALVLLGSTTLVLAGCGGATGETTMAVATPQAAATGGASTGVAATGVAATSVATTAPSPVPTNSAQPKPTQAVASPAPCPETTSAAEARSEDCEQLYQQLLATYAEDYSSCVPATAQAGTCQKPEDLDDELKEQVNIQLVIDSSGSMAEDLGGQTKMDIAKNVMTAFIDTIPEQANLALRVYGHTGSNADADRPVSCQGSALFYPFGQRDATKFKAAIDSFQPTGWTPIALALQQAQADFAAYDGATNSNIIYLVSDGIETCDGDPVAVAKALHESSIQAVVNIVGFGVDAAAAAQLREAAAQGGGKYYEARNAQELEDVFTERINWKAWNEYYGCVFQKANEQVGDTFREQNEAISCVTQKANKEAIAFRNALNNDAEKYGTCRKAVQQQVGARFDNLTSAAQDNYTEVVDQAQRDYDEAVEDAGDEYTENTQQPTARP